MLKEKQKPWLKQLKQLKELTPQFNYCKVCFKPILENDWQSFIHLKTKLCFKCFQKIGFSLKETRVDKYKIIRICSENDLIKSLLFQYTCACDYELKDIFTEYYLSFIKAMFKDYQIYYLKTEFDDKGERKFKRSKEIYKCIGLKEIENIMDSQGFSNILIAGIAAEYHNNYLEIMKYFGKFNFKNISLIFIY